MRLNYDLQYSVYDNAYINDFPLDQLFINTYKKLPSKYTFNEYYNESILSYFKENGFIEESRISTSFDDYYDFEKDSKIKLVNDFSRLLLFNEDKKMLISLNRIMRLKNQINFNVYYDIDCGELKNQLDLNVIETYKSPRLNDAKINLVVKSGSHLDTQEFKLNIPEIDIELNYGKKFNKIHKTIVKRLNNNNDKGIILFHGEPGTGKTSYIKYLTKLLDKKILFIPPTMAEALSEPSIIPFLLENKNSILIIEDAERVIADRETQGTSMGVSNILNITDGILGDCLNIQIIATFNSSRDKIDKALLRPGRLIVEHKFEKLDVESTNKLFKYLKIEKESNDEMTLADIYNINVDIHKSENKTKKIGF